MGSLSVSWDLLIQIGVNLVIVVAWGTRTDGRLRALESHSATIAKVDPMEARLNELKENINRRLDEFSGSMRDLAKSVQDLARSKQWTGI